MTRPRLRRPAAAGVLPRGGSYVAGAGAIASQGYGLVITQPGSTRGVIEWNSFSIGRHNSVTFDNGSGATPNRVTGGSPSEIIGRLSATGSLYVINPQGTVANQGQIKAAQVSLQAADRNVYALAGGGTRIRATKTASRDGHVWLVATVAQLTPVARSTPRAPTARAAPSTRLRTTCASAA